MGKYDGVVFGLMNPETNTPCTVAEALQIFLGMEEGPERDNYGVLLELLLQAVDDKAITLDDYVEMEAQGNMLAIWPAEDEEHP